MFGVFKSTWALLLGVLLLMTGNGLQGTLLGVRGTLEGFDAASLSIVMSGYFVGFLGGSKLAPVMIRNVGHVRVFAALASFISAAFIIYAAFPDPVVWFFMRVIVGFCYCGVYVVAESWLNASTTNENRGKALSLYLIVQMVGVTVAQGLLNVADPGGYMLFIVMSVLVSISFGPILLTVSVAPVFETTKPMSLRKLFVSSPLGIVGTFILGGIFAQMFGMSAVYASDKGLNVAETSIFVAAMYVGGTICQYPIGYISDHMDRRLLITGLTTFAAVTLLAGSLISDHWYMLLSLAFILGAISNPLYSLLIAHTNDFLAREDMASASGGLLFVNGLGAVSGPILLGWLMSTFGSDIYFPFIAVLFALIAFYGTYRMTKRPSRAVSETIHYTQVMPQASAVAVEVAQEVSITRARAEDAQKEAND